MRATGARAWERRTWGHESAPWCKAAKTGTGAAGGLGAWSLVGGAAIQTATMVGTESRVYEGRAGDLGSCEPRSEEGRPGAQGLVMGSSSCRRLHWGSMAAAGHGVCSSSSARWRRTRTCARRPVRCSGAGGVCGARLPDCALPVEKVGARGAVYGNGVRLHTTLVSRGCSRPSCSEWPAQD